MIEFPSSLLREQSVYWDIVGNVISGGRTGIDAAPLVRTDGGGLIVAKLASISLRTAQQVRAWRALSALLDGGATPFVLPMCDKRYMPAPVIGGVTLYGYPDVSHDDETAFDDDSGYSQPAVVANVVASAALRATSMAIHFSVGSALQGGEWFAIEHPTMGWRAYLIGSVTINSGNNSVVTFRPPLREAVTADTPIEFDQPKCIMRLARPDSMRAALDLRRVGSPTLDCLETFDV